MILNNKGASTVIAAVMVFLLIIGICGVELLTLNSYNSAMNQRISNEQEILQERIQLFKLNNVIIDNQKYVDQIFIKNTGSIAVAIQSIYVDNKFLFDASNQSINPLGNHVNPNATKSISFQGLPNQNRTYQPSSMITVVTDKGTRSLALEKTLADYNDTVVTPQTNFGPVRLDFKVFSYATYDNVSIGPWQPGWEINNQNVKGGIIWKVNVTNVGTGAITLTKNTCFFLMAVSPGDIRQWYLNITSPIAIAPNQTQTLIFVWKTPGGTNVYNIFSVDCTCRVFMAFFGTYQTTEKPLAQTIPFQSVNVV